MVKFLIYRKNFHCYGIYTTYIKYTIRPPKHQLRSWIYKNKYIHEFFFIWFLIWFLFFAIFPTLYILFGWKNGSRNSVMCSILTLNPDWMLYHHISPNESIDGNKNVRKMWHIACILWRSTTILCFHLFFDPCGFALFHRRSMEFNVCHFCWY